MAHSTRHKKHKANNRKSSISSRGRKKAFWLLIILGVIVMFVYAVSFQGAKDEELVEETQPQSQQQ